MPASTFATAVADVQRRLDEHLIAFGDRVHAAGDQAARDEGWTVTRAGRTGRVYRDPRFNAIGGAR